MLQEKTQHLTRGVGAIGVGVAPLIAAACPGMAGTVDDPQFAVRHTARTVIDRSRDAVLAVAGE